MDTELARTASEEVNMELPTGGSDWVGDDEVANKRPSDTFVAFKMPLQHSGARLIKALTKHAQKQHARHLSPPPSADSQASEPAHDDDDGSNNVVKSTLSAPTGDATADSKSPPPLPYKEPRWSGVPPRPYNFEVLKGGVIVGSVDLSARPFTVCGRLATCHIAMEHPSISRHHAVVQYCAVAAGSGQEVDVDITPPGFYVYDLGSTHGTFLNKSLLKPRCYYPLHVGHMLKFGGSSRAYLLQGPSDEEESPPWTVTELKTRRRERGNALQADSGGEAAPKSGDHDEGIDWGMGEDATEEDDDGDLGINPFAQDVTATNEDTYIDDPKKTLRGWFEREGYELEYDVEEMGQANFRCRIRLPVDMPSGAPHVVEAAVKGKKKEAVVACALEACHTLDRQGLLRQATHEGHRRKRRNWEDDDYYDSDEDTYLDRTGTIEKKRQMRIQRTGGGSRRRSDEHFETYESLGKTYEKIGTETAEIEVALRRSNLLHAKHVGGGSGNEEDTLDEYMKAITGGVAGLDKKEKSRLKLKLHQLKQEADRVRRLMEIARPTTLPPISSPPRTPYTPQRSSHNHSLHRPTAHSDSTGNSGREVTAERSKPLMPTRETSQTCNDGSPPRTVSDRPDDAKEESGARETTSATAEKAYLPGMAPKPAETGANKQRQGTRRRKEIRYNYDESDPNYAMWLPPNDQTGDGKTSLNEKFGY